MTGQIIILVPILYVALQWTALHKMKDGWQVAALLPAVMMAGALVVMALGLLTHADIALLALMLGLPIATAYLLVLWPLHLILGRQH